MSEGEVARLTNAIADLSRKADRQHEENQKAQSADRAAFAQAMSQQRDAFQDALNKQYLEHLDLKSDVKAGNTLLKLCVGDGQPGNGRLGLAEVEIEKLKKFAWQAMAVVATLLLLADHAQQIFIKH